MKTNLPNTFKKLRIMLGLTQEQLARLLGKGRTDISKYENGKSIPPGDIVETVYSLLRKNSGEKDK